MGTINPILLSDNRLDDGTPSASSTATGYNVLNLRDWRAGTWWKPSALPATVTVDCAAAKAANTLAIYGHTLYSCGCTLEVRGSTDNFSASDVLLGSLAPGSDKPFLIQFNSASYRYWRIRITGGATMPVIAIAALGVALEFPQPVENGFDPLGPKLVGNIDVARNGSPLGRTIEHQAWTETLKFQNLTDAWFRANWIPAWPKLRGNPAIFAWDSAYHSGDIYHVIAGDGFSAPYRAGALVDLSFALSGMSQL